MSLIASWSTSDAPSGKWSWKRHTLSVKMPSFEETMVDSKPLGLATWLIWLPQILSSWGHTKYLSPKELLGASLEQMVVLGHSKSSAAQHMPESPFSDAQKLWSASTHSSLHCELLLMMYRFCKDLACDLVALTAVDVRRVNEVWSDRCSSTGRHKTR